MGVVLVPMMFQSEPGNAPSGGMMKVQGFKLFQCDAGWRTFSFLKLTTDGTPILRLDGSLRPRPAPA